MSSHSSLHQSIAAVAHAPGHFLHNAKANGLMKRNSIFSRPASRNSSIDLDTSILDLSRPTHCASSPPEPTPRPSTSTASLMERSNTDPSIGKRHSLFRSRRKSNRKNVRAEDAEGAEIAPKDFRSDEEYRSHLRKQSISPPFNFQHLSHTRRKHVPGLGTVDESGSFRVPANPKPIEPVRSRPTTPCLPTSGPGPQHSSSRSVDVSQGRQTMPSTVVRPRAASCQTRNGNEPVSQVVGLSMSNPNIPATSADIPPITAQVQHCSPSEIKYRAKQPLPALPQRATSQGHPKRMTQDSQLSCSTTSSSDSYRSSTHMRTAGPWTCLDEHGSTLEPFEASWEEDVDFCYEREAESTCDFNWDENEQIDAGFRLSKYLQPIEGSRNSALFASPIINTSPVQPRRSSIVGHRGFLQARNNSTSHATADDRASAHESQDQLVSITEESKQLFGPEIMHKDTSLENSSDNASTRTGTSFYDDSDAHPVPSSGDNGHSSVASLSSVPELMPSSYSTSSNDATASTEHVAPLPSRQSFSSCDVMRKPSTLSNRAILQAGRVVQRGRVSSNASMGGRISRMPSKQFQRPVADGEEATTWI